MEDLPKICEKNLAEMFFTRLNGNDVYLSFHRLSGNAAKRFLLYDSSYKVVHENE